MIRKLTITNGNYNMGLLDYFNQGKQWLQNQPQMADPHANARALMGGQAMQYNQQPQSLIAPQTQAGTGGMVGPVSPLPGDINVKESQQPYVSYNPNQIQPDFTNVPLDTWQDPATAGGHVAGTVYDTPGGRMNAAPVNSLLMGNAQTPQGVVGVEPDPEYNTPTDNTNYSGVDSNVPQTNPYPEPPNIIGEAFDPSLTEEEKRLREEALSRLPWYLGGKR